MARCWSCCYSNSVEIEEEEVNVSSSALPEDIVEKIVAMLPFPFIFTARALSKSWLARLSAISSLDDKEEKCLAISFQKQVGQQSAKWKTFCPVFSVKKDSIAYDRASQQWQRMPSLSFLPDTLLTLQPENYHFRRSNLQIEGALVLLSTFWKNGGRTSDFDLYAANILTRSWKALPPRPRLPDGVKIYEIVLIPASLQTYKLVLFFTGSGSSSDFDYFNFTSFAQIYDSSLGLWSSKGHIVSEDLLLTCSWASGWAYVKDFPLWSNWAYLDGVLYSVLSLDKRPPGSIKNPLGLMAFNVAEETFEVLPLPAIEQLRNMVLVLPELYIGGCSNLLVCNDNLVVIVRDPEKIHWWIVLKINLESRTWSEVTRGPPFGFHLDRCALKRLTSDGNCIFFSVTGRHKSNTILAYNFHEDEWSLVPIHPIVLGSYGNTRYPPLEKDIFSFQPGLNPFVTV